jgi:hypothetical protein
LVELEYGEAPGMTWVVETHIKNQELRWLILSCPGRWWRGCRICVRWVLSGPGVEVDAGLGAQALQALKAVAGVDSVAAALAGAGSGDVRRRSLTGGVVAVVILGLCLFSGEGYAGVLARLWPVLGTFNPGLLLGGPVSAVALSGARARLPVAVMRALFEAGAARGGVEPVYGQRVSVCW